MKRIKLSEYAQKMCITSATALNWYHQGKIPYPTERPSQRIILVQVPDDFDGTNISPENSSGKTVAYCRVSTHKQKSGLDLQELSILKYANSQGLTIDKTIKEVGSGFNENRVKLGRMLKDPTITTIIVEHRDRLARSNFNLIKHCLEAQGRKIIVINDDELEDDLVTEITEFMVSRCGKIYGRKSAKRVKEALKEVDDNE